MKKSKQDDKCLHCGSTNWNRVNKRGRDGQRSVHNGDIYLCVDCHNETELGELVDGGYRYFVYAGHSFDTPEEAIQDLQDKLKRCL